jgi:CheY-like chemotaxis protein
MKKYRDTDVLTTGEVSRIACVAPRTVSKWFDSGVLGGYKIPGSKDRRMPVPVVREFLRSHGMPLNDLAEDKRVLIIDDDKDVTDILKKILIEEHYEVEVATDSFSIGNIVGAFNPQVVLLSTDIPSIDALNIANRLKKPNRKIVAMGNLPTCVPTPPVYDHTISKPFHVANVVSLVATLIQVN